MHSVTKALLLFFFLPFVSFASIPVQLYFLDDGIKRFGVEPETFLLTYTNSREKEFKLSVSGEKEKVGDLSVSPTAISWNYPLAGIHVSLVHCGDYIDVSISGDAPSEYTWPMVGADVEAYTVPLHQGKYIPAGDRQWAEHLGNQGYMNALEVLSMQFFALNMDEQAFVYVIKNKYNNKLDFYNDKGTISLNFIHEFPETVADNTYGFRIYPVPNDITDIAKTYKKYVSETKGIKTLEEKAGNNPGIKKLYGAPHIYIWNNEFIVRENINDKRGLYNFMRSELQEGTINPTVHLFKLFNQSETGKGFADNMEESDHNILNTDYGSRLFIQSVNDVLKRKDFFDDSAFAGFSGNMEILQIISDSSYIKTNKGLYQLNKQAFYHAYSEYLDKPDEWGGAPLSLIDEMRSSGISSAWIGLDSWVAGEIHPSFISAANKAGYLIGPYDSYHSIHPPGEERWLTATFEDTTLYHSAYVMNKRGVPIGGFLGVGRKLNPLLSFESVYNRTKSVMKQGIEFNSWFVDCDATGECYDDYTPSRMTSQQDDMEARLKRMSWIRDTYGFVVGSEVGNDFAANTISYAHGMTTPVVAWGDHDMRTNSDSEFFIGTYYSLWGGIPGRYVKEVPIKEKYRYIYFDNRFSIPLFQLVYNDAVITSHHWEWGSLKVPSEVKNTGLKEILYNVPPLYHLDRNHWAKYRDFISEHVAVFAQTHTNAVVQKMSSFEWLSGDRLVQKTQFGDTMEIVANFGSQPFKYKEANIPGMALAVFHDGFGDYYIYKP